MLDFGRGPESGLGDWRRLALPMCGQGPSLMVINSAICLDCLPSALGCNRFLWISAGSQLLLWDVHFQEIKESTGRG